MEATNALTCLGYYYDYATIVSQMAALWRNDIKQDLPPQYYLDLFGEKFANMTNYHVKCFKALMVVADPAFSGYVFGMNGIPFTQSRKRAEMLHLKMVTRQKELELKQLKRLHREAIRALKL